MKVLVVCQHFYPEQFRVNDICFELVKAGHDVTVLTGLPNYPTGKVSSKYRFFRKRNETIHGVHIKRVSIVGRGKSIIRMGLNYVCFATFASIKALFMKKTYDIAYVYQISPISMAWPALVMAKRAKIPCVIHCLDQWPISVTTGPISNKGLFYKFLCKLSVATYRRASLITISSRSFVDYFQEELKISMEDKGLVYYPSYAEDVYGKTKRIDNEVFDLVFAGNIGPAQSVETIILAAEHLNKRDDIVFHIVGDGLSRETVENMAIERGLKNVVFHGFHVVEEMEEYYNLADAFLITMVDNDVVNSTLPAKVQSYMMAKKPILGAISGEVRLVISEANCGLCVSSLDHQGLADIILQLKDDKDLQRDLGNNAYLYYRNNFEKELCLQQLQDIMQAEINKFTNRRRQ